MKKTYIVTINAKRGAAIAPAERIKSVVFGTDTSPMCENYKSVDVTEQPTPSVGVLFKSPLYALACKDKDDWGLLDFYGTKKKADNAVHKSADNYRKCGLKGEFATMVYDTSTRLWKLDGYYEKA